MRASLSARQLKFSGGVRAEIKYFQKKKYFQRKKKWRHRTTTGFGYGPDEIFESNLSHGLQISTLSLETVSSQRVYYFTHV
jgi:hypothetical protein